VTFQEVRQHLGLNTPRNWSRSSVLRTVPCLLGLFSGVCLIYHRHTQAKGSPPRQSPWYAKSEVSFADAIANVRRLLWWQTILKQSHGQQHLQKLPRKLRDTLLNQFSRAA
jgi:hypothetical protein